MKCYKFITIFFSLCIICVFSIEAFSHELLNTSEGGYLLSIYRDNLEEVKSLVKAGKPYRGNTRNAWIVKTDNFGNILWNKIINDKDDNSNSYTVAYCAKQLPNNTYLIVIKSCSQEGTRLIILNLDHNGKTIFKDSYQVKYEFQYAELNIKDDGSFFIAIILDRSKYGVMTFDFNKDSQLINSREFLFEQEIQCLKILPDGNVLFATYDWDSGSSILKRLDPNKNTIVDEVFKERCIYSIYQDDHYDFILGGTIIENKKFSKGLWVAKFSKDYELVWGKKSK